MEHIFLIHSSGRTDRQLLARIRTAAAEAGMQCLIRDCRRTIDITSAVCRDAAPGTPVRFYVCGSDAALCAAARAAVGFFNVELGLIPSADGSDFLRSYPHAAFSSPAAQLCGVSRSIDLIDCNGQLFVGSVRLCLPHAPLLHARDHLEPPPFLAAACDDGTLLTGCFRFAGVGNTPFAGGRHVFPHADPSNGSLMLCLQRAGQSPLSARSSSARICRKVTRLVLIPRQPVHACGDGQTFRALRLSFRLIPGCVRFIVPASPSFIPRSDK